MLLYYIRHGDPIYDPDSLTALGQEQAKAVAKRLAMHGIDEIYCSSSNRAVMTAQPLCDLLKMEAVKMDWCTEARAGKALGARHDDGSFGWAVTSKQFRPILLSNEVRSLGDRWYDHPELIHTGMKEGYLGICEDLDRWIATLGYQRDEENHCYIPQEHNEKRIALFAHWGMGGAIMSHLLDIPYPQFATHFSMSHSTMTVVEFRNREGVVNPQVLSYGNDSHLYREGLPTKCFNRIYI